MTSFMRNILFLFAIPLFLCCGQHKVTKNNLVRDDSKGTSHLAFLKEELGSYGVNYTIKYNEKYCDKSKSIETSVEEVDNIDPMSMNLWKQVKTIVGDNLEKNRIPINKLFVDFFIREGLPVPRGRVTMQVTILNDGSLLKMILRFKDNYVMESGTGIKLFEEFDNSGFFIPWEEKKVEELFFVIPIIVNDDFR